MMKILVATMTVVGVMLVGTPAGATAPTRAPRACLRALDRGEIVMALAVEGFDLAAQGFQAAADSDAVALSRINGLITNLAPQVRTARNAYDRSASACRAS